MAINCEFLLVFSLIVSGQVFLEGATISQNSDFPTQNDTFVNVTTTSTTQPTPTNSSEGENTATGKMSESKTNMHPVWETSASEAGTKLASLVRRHGDFDNLEQETRVPEQKTGNEKQAQKEAKKGKETQVPEKVAKKGKVSQKETAPPEKVIAKNINTRVMSTESFDESACQTKIKGPLMRLYANSKYFADSENTYTYTHAKEICQEYDLVLAELESIVDHRTVQFFVGQYRIVDQESKKFLIGMNDIKTEGIFTLGNGKQLPFQNFHLSQPDDQNKDEDCVALLKEEVGGPVGSADVNCNTPAHVLCMLPPGTECYKESRETQESSELMKNPGLISVISKNVTGARSYFVSNFQLTWNRAMRYCARKNMTVFSLDGDVTMRFFEALLNWETDFVQAPSPPLQYWTSGRFKGTHMNAEIVWLTKPLDTSSSEEFEVESESSYTSHFNFTWSGVYRWSSKKGVDPGGPHGYRRDVCVSFGFEERPEASPRIRNTNCDLPTYFICSESFETQKSKDDD